MPKLGFFKTQPLFIIVLQYLPLNVCLGDDKSQQNNYTWLNFLLRSRSLRWLLTMQGIIHLHDDFIKWKHFPRYWPFVRGIHRSPVNSPHKGQWRGALVFSLIYVWRNGWVNERDAGGLRHYRAHYDVTVMHWLYCPFRPKCALWHCHKEHVGGFETCNLMMTEPL